MRLASYLPTPELRCTMTHWGNFAEASKIKCEMSRYYKLGNSYVCLKFSSYSFGSTKDGGVGSRSAE